MFFIPQCNAIRGFADVRDKPTRLQRYLAALAAALHKAALNQTKIDQFCADLGFWSAPQQRNELVDQIELFAHQISPLFTMGRVPIEHRTRSSVHLGCSSVHLDAAS